MAKLIETRHPNYTQNSSNWRKWRLTYEGGTRFIRKYLVKMGKRENDEDFQSRYNLTYCPAFAKAALNEVKNSIFQRACDITRSGGSVSYTDAVAGRNSGVDLMGSSMDSFLGRKILPELLSMGRVGIYVDMPQLTGPTKKDLKGKRPYLYWYRTEDILSWSCDDYENPTEVTNLLLGDSIVDTDDDSFLPSNESRRFRHVYIDSDTGYVAIQFYCDDSVKCDPYGDKENDSPILLAITKIPFVMLEISESLLADVADYQIALLNMESADVSYAIKGNFPFYVEQFDPRSNNPYAKQLPPNEKTVTQTNFDPSNGSIVVNQEKVEEIRVGVGSGRRYPVNTNQPAFINPSSEPLQASMAKEAQLKQDIRALINLAVTNLQPTKTKPTDDTGLEAGLSYIGLELEHAERRIAEFWATYEGSEAATISYPENYSLVTDAERREQAKELKEMMPHLPSKTYQKEIAKSIARILLNSKVSSDTLKKIQAEIDAADVIITDPDVIQTDFEAGFVGLDTASRARGYPAGEVEKAKTDHADRAARIAISQSVGGGFGASARGVPSLDPNLNSGSKEKTASRDTTLNDNTKSPVRGQGQ